MTGQFYLPCLKATGSPDHVLCFAARFCIYCPEWLRGDESGMTLRNRANGADVNNG